MKKKLSFIKNEIIEDNSLLSSYKEKDKEELKELLKKSPLNLSVYLMKISLKNNYTPLSIEKFYESVFSEMDNLRRTDGSRYRTKSISTVRSAIVSNKLFSENKKGLYSLNIKECIKYLKLIINSYEKNNSNNKKQNKLTNKKFKINYDSNNNDNNQHNLLGKKRKNVNDITDIQIEKYRHVYELMENTLEMYSKDKDLNKKIKIHFPKCNNYKEIIEKYKNNDNIIEGILSMYKYFKPFLKNRLFSINEVNYLNNLNSKIEGFKEELNLSKFFLNN